MSRALSQREKVLSWIVGGAVLVIVNALVISYFLENRARLSREAVLKTAQLSAMKQLLVAAPQFAEQDAKIRTSQPTLENEATAGVQLLNQVQEAARRDAVTIEQPAIGGVDHRPYFTSVAITIETKSTWKSLVIFLSKLQSPTQYIVVDSGELQIDAGDPTQMRGRFQISKWYAPK